MSGERKGGEKVSYVEKRERGQGKHNASEKEEKGLKERQRGKASQRKREGL